MTKILPTNATSSADYSAIVKVAPFGKMLATEELFNKTYKEGNVSPIDEFIGNSNKLNLLWLSLSNEEVVPEFSNILFLGYFSAVESYIRALIRSLIQHDIYSFKCAESQEISFGAALHHSKELLPEALMDSHSFVSSGNILRTFKSLTDIDVAMDESSIQELDKICQLRHCCVHRFGKLGAKNAMVLGLSTHSTLFEKPLVLSKNDLILISGTLRSVVKTINNAAYKSVLDRTFPVVPTGKGDARKFEKILWQRDYNLDKVLFSKYYKIFYSKHEKSPAAKEMYMRFISEKEQLLQKIAGGKRQSEAPKPK
ncbi:hypothetical protein AB3464_12675 [Pseudomonas asplenii]|uniref:hypothetical protein n=1 Tax=Pseudomonas asplenii TaxID=53407 RepID=UPI0037C823B4